jgi:hypothetical protein
MNKSFVQERAAKELAAYISDPNQKYIARPYNMYYSEISEYYVLPSKSKNPAYPHGKYSFKQNNQGYEGSFYIEKGLSIPTDIAKLVSVNKETIMNDAWQWYTFVEDVNKNAIELDNEWSIEVMYYEYNHAADAVTETFHGRELSSVIERFTQPNYDYWWINLYITPLDHQSDVERLYDNHLSKFIQWVR